MSPAKLAAAPAWLVEALVAKPRRTREDRPRGAAPLASTGFGMFGPTILEGTRDDTLARIAGRLHDGTRTLEDLTEDLMAVNEARCSPPMTAREVEKIARSIHARPPCTPGPPDRVRAKIAYLRDAAARRGVKGMAGSTAWSVYTTGLDALERHGTDHERGVVLSLDVRTYAQMAGTSRTSVSRHIKRSALMEKLPHKAGDRCMRVLFLTPPGIGVYLGHSNHWVSYAEDSTVPTGPLSEVLRRLRWGPGRIGKSRAALLARLVECGEMARVDLAESLGRTPDALKKPLRWLLDRGLVVRTGRGLYAPAADLAEQVERWRESGREPEADRLQIARHNREREAYRKRQETRPDPAPTTAEMGSDPRRGDRLLRIRVDRMVGSGWARRTATMEATGADGLVDELLPQAREGHG